MQEFDVVIIGGGPVGGFVAKKIATEGFNVAVFEEHSQIGTPLKCAGLVTPRVFELLDFSKKTAVQNEIRGAHIHSPSGHTLTIGGDKIHALVIDRQIFDREIINQSLEQKAQIFLKNKAISAKKHLGHIELKTSQKNNVKCKLLIGADGPNSKTREWFKLSRPAEFLNGIGAEVKNTNLDPNFVEIFTGKNIAPGFFAWMIPTKRDGSEARIGLCTSSSSLHSPKHYFTNFFKNQPCCSYLENAEITKKIAGIIPLGVLKKTYAPNLLLVGDAAAQVKPTSGGGIYTGILCAKHCASTAIEALNKNNFTISILKKYHKQWYTDVGRELNLGMKLRLIFRNLNDQQLDNYIKKFQNQTIIDIISKHGDIDYPSKLIRPILEKTPSLIKLLPKIIKK